MREKLTLEHLIIFGVSVISALISIKQNVGLPKLNQVLNPVAAFVMAGIAGYIAKDAGLPVGIQSGIAWLAGQLGNKAMDVLLTALKMAKRDPLKFAASVIALVWQWFIPPLKKNDEPDQ